MLPNEVVGRDVVSGELGCPVCGATYPIERGTARLGQAPASQAGESSLEANGAHALLGLTGPGGFVALIGAAAALAGDLAALVEGVHLVALNAPLGIVGSDSLSLVQAATMPFKAKSFRGVILGPGYGSDLVWLGEADRVTLPGLRIVGEGRAPARDGWEPLGSAGQVWVVRRG